MTRSLQSTAARPLFLGWLIVLLGLSSTCAHMLGSSAAPAGHVAIRPFHGPFSAQRGSSWRGWGGPRWNAQRDFAWRGHYRQDGWPRGAWSGRERHGWTGRDGYAWGGPGRYGRDGWGWGWRGRGNNGQGDWGGLWASGSWVANPEPNGVATGPEIIVLGGAPLPAGSAHPAASSGSSEQGEACVIHQLEYDGAGNYVGEKETPNC